MKAILLTPTSPKSTTTAVEEEADRSENRDSCYFPGCRKDANCNCEMCLASISATLDLMPVSIQKSSLSKLSSSRPTVESTPLSFDSSVLTTPKSNTPRIRLSPELKSSGRMSLKPKEEKERSWAFDNYSLRVILILGLIVAADSWFPWAISQALRPAMSPEIVANLGQNSQFVGDLNGKLRFLQKELQGLVGSRVSNCSHGSSSWELEQEGLLLNSRCTLFKSAIEEVSIWGWPLETGGLLTSGKAHRSFTILSGRLTEWPEGGIDYSVRKVNSSWGQKKSRASTVQLDPATWILEYRRSSLLDSSSFHAAAMEFLGERISRTVRRLKQDNCKSFSSPVENKPSRLMEKHDIVIPT